ncbi:hypothetical protein M422DRAFT_273036 [Sphaerobolus stellatus SS14]|uniref:Condensation domain-containing protein n=1 Tax=Sphaerobolus stellatus (strain SS14) TaxID=990650 RepID=A0A0C9UA67_SPHS4|nr:hypothetical protein M422DRAFT_273036 [Sphaerobolus stellatus SS14]
MTELTVWNLRRSAWPLQDPLWRYFSYGHSLAAMRILIRLRKEFNIKLDIRIFMKDLSVLGITGLVATSQRDSTLPNNIDSISSDCRSLPASDAQTRIWVEEQMHPGLTRYNSIFQRRLTGALHLDALRKAFLYLVHRHEPLRTTFNLVDGVLIQTINAPEPKMIRTISIEGVSKNAEIQAQQIPDRQSFRGALLSICTDGWSMGTIEKELSIAYNSYLDGQDPCLWPLSVRYRDYSMWGKTKQNTTEVEDQLQYWEKHLKGVAPLELPLDFLRPKELSCNWDEVAFDISASCVETMQNLASKHTTSLFSVLLAAFRATLYRMTGLKMETWRSIRLIIDEETNLDDLIIQSKSVLRDALKNLDAPFDRVVSQLAPKRDISQNSFAQIDFSSALDDDEMPQMRGVGVEEIRRPSTRLDISVYLFRRGTSIRDACKPSPTDPRPSISNPNYSLPLATPASLQKFSEWNETSRPLNQELVILDRFREIARLHGSDVAVIDESISLTYSELNERSDCLASWLIARKFPAESVIGIWMGRSALLVTAYLACLKAGLAYKSLPNSRLTQMISTSGCRLVLSYGKFPLGDLIPFIDLSIDDNLLCASANVASLARGNGNIPKSRTVCPCTCSHKITHTSALTLSPSFFSSRPSSISGALRPPRLPGGLRAHSPAGFVLHDLGSERLNPCQGEFGRAFGHISFSSSSLAGEVAMERRPHQ